MGRPLNVSERRIAAVAVLTLLLWLLWYLLVESWFLGPLRSLADEADSLRNLQSRYARLLKQEPVLQAQLEASNDDPSISQSLIPGDDPVAAAAELMQRVSDAVDEQAQTGAGCELLQRMPFTPEPLPNEPYRQVKVSLRLACATEPLVNLLNQLEYGQPYLYVDELSVRRSKDAPALGGPGRLDVNLLLLGYMKPITASVNTP